MGKKRDYFRRYHARRYQAHSFRNPHQHLKQNKKLFWKRLAIGLVATGVFSLGVYGVFFSPFWMIQEVKVEGLQFMGGGDILSTANQQLDEHSYVIFSNRHRLFFDQEELAAILNHTYSFESLRFNISRHILTIQITERVSEVLWKSGDGYFFVDTHGTVIRSLPQNDAAWISWYGFAQPLVQNEPVEGPFPTLDYLNSLPLISDESRILVEPGMRVLAPNGMEALLAFDAQARERNLGVSHYETERQDSVWVRARTIHGYDLLVDLTQDTAQQLQNIQNVLEYDIADRTQLEYIDVRFGNHVYYKLK